MSPDAGVLDGLRLNFSPSGLLALNITLALIMFGVALDLRLADFREALRRPRHLLLGALAQLALLPALSFGLVLLLEPAPSLALGMILVAACPGGNTSNFMSHYAGGDTASSIGLTAISTVSAVALTPLHLSLWGGLYAPAAPLLTAVALDPLDMAGTIGLILLAPLAAGMALTARRPTWAARLRTPMRRFSLLAFGGFVVAALGANFGYFLEYIHVVFGLVLLHNTLAFALGWLVGGLGGATEAGRRTLTIEVGIQNSGLGLILCFDFFDGLGGMAFVLAWWGVWHLIAGLFLATRWSRRPLRAATMS